MSMFGESYERPVYHGGDLDNACRIYGGDKSQWIDLSTGINPIPYPIPTIPMEQWARLPESASEQKLLAAARDYYKLPNTYHIVAAPGTQSLIQQLPNLFGRTLKVSIAKPTYAEHETCWRYAGHDVLPLTDKTIAADVIIAVNPNNPTGKTYSASELTDLKAKHLAQGGLLILDEAFMDICPDQSTAHTLPSENTIILKSFGKFFGLAGLRLGFAAGDKTLIEKLRSKLGPWAVSGPAAFVGSKAYSDTKWITETNIRPTKDCARLYKMLQEADGKVMTSAGLFVTAEFQDAPLLFEHLCRHHILTRPFSYAENWLRFGLPANKEQWTRLEQVLAGFY